MVPVFSLFVTGEAEVDPRATLSSFLDGDDVSEQPSCCLNVFNLALKASTGALKVVSPVYFQQVVSFHHGRNLP